MKPSELAEQMKERQVKLGIVPKEILMKLSDEEMISSYLTCAECKTDFLTYAEAVSLAEDCKDIEEFFDKLDLIDRGH